MMHRNTSFAGWGARLLSTTALALVLPNTAHANPTDGSVAAGTATIVLSVPKTLTVNQSTQKAIINWQSFSIGQGETTIFNQPSASAITLNRITGGDPSSILGNLRANGQVWLVNPNGIAFGTTARVDVAGLLATTIDIADRDFMSGNYRFSVPGNPSAMVVNAGQITVRDTGLAALVAPGVENSGFVQANLGQIQLSSAAAFTVDLYGDGLFNFTLDKQVTQAIRKPDGTKPVAAVTNSGQLIANGGRILLTANAAKSVVDHAINMDGYAQATSASVSATGEIVLDGGSEGDVQVAGTIDASGQNGANGGTIKVLANKTNGTVEVSGTLDASAPNGGNGGFVETSAAHVKVSNAARITTSAPMGTTGAWFVDPHDYTVAATGGDITGTALSTQLANNNVTILSSGGAAGANGDVNVNDAVSWNAHTLTLTAFNNINVNAVMSASGAASIALNPGTDNGSDPDATFLAIGRDPSGNFKGRVDFSGAGTFSISGIQYTVINSLGIAGDTSTITLQGITNNLSGHYVLGSDIDASSTASWNSGAGFMPIGGGAEGAVLIDPFYSSSFKGIFDGLGHTISGLTIHSSANVNVGLFGNVWGAKIANLDLSNIDYTVTTEYASVGGLVGYSFEYYDNFARTVANVNVSGAISVDGYAEVGGLVGTNRGNIIGSRSSVSVTGVDGAVGGLVGGNQSGLDNTGNIRQSSSSGLVRSTGTANTGGLVGGNTGIVEESYSTGDVSCEGDANCGGFAGSNEPYWGTIAYSYSTGDVTANSSAHAVGGLVGYSTRSIDNSYTTSHVSNTGSSTYVGGLVGKVAESHAEWNSYWDTDTTGLATSAAGSALSDAQLRASLPSGFVTSIWGHDAAINSGYPYLLSNHPVVVTIPPVGGTVTWSVANTSSTYGTLATLGTATLTGVAVVDASNVQYTLGLFVDPSGMIPITLSPSMSVGTYYEGVTALTGTAASNYTLGTTGNTFGVLTINPKMLTWRTTDYSSTYGTLATLQAATLTGVLPTDAGNVNGVIGLVANGTTVSLSATTPAGSYSETVRSLTGSAASNYTLSLAGNTVGTFTVNPKALTWSVSDASYAYGSSPDIGTATLNGVVGNDHVDGFVGIFLGTTPVAITSTTLMGSYAEKVVALINTDAHNYTLASSGNRPGTLTVQLSKADATHVNQAQSQTAAALLAWNNSPFFHELGDSMQAFWDWVKKGAFDWFGNSQTNSTSKPGQQTPSTQPGSTNSLISPALVGVKTEMGTYGGVLAVPGASTDVTWGYDDSAGVKRVVMGSFNTRYAPIDSMTVEIATPSGTAYRTINAYPNVDANGNDISKLGPFQCTALVASYLSALGFDSAATQLPRGALVAQTLGADQSHFEFSASGAYSPKVGSIVSFPGPSENGHVAIIKGMIQPDANTIVATLIEQNWSWTDKAGAVKFAKDRTVAFALVDGRWTAKGVANWATPISTPLSGGTPH